MDGFVQNTGAMAQGCDASSVMDYFDGNTVTAMWNCAQHFALSDNATTDQASITRFVEDNWRLGRLGDQSFDALANPLTGLFAFGRRAHASPLFLDPRTGARRG